MREVNEINGISVIVKNSTVLEFIVTIVTASPTKLRKGNAFSRVCVPTKGGPHVIFTHDAVGQLQVTWEPPGPSPARRLWTVGIQLKCLLVSRVSVHPLYVSHGWHFSIFVQPCSLSPVHVGYSSFPIIHSNPTCCKQTRPIRPPGETSITSESIVLIPEAGSHFTFTTEPANLNNPSKCE